MAKRLLRTYKVDSTEVQGEGSWVELRYVISEDGEAYFSNKVPEKEFLENHVVDWDWVDSDDKPLNLKDGIGKLIIPEREFLIAKLFSSDKEERKNS